MIALAALFVVPGALRAPAAVQGGASVQQVTDADGDGLSDGAELILKTAIYVADTDGDGVSDPEELARDTDPLNPKHAPQNVQPSIGLDATAHDGFLHLIQTVYLPSGDMSSVQVSLGGMLWGRLRFLPPKLWAHNSEVTVLPAAQPGGLLLVIDTRLRPELVHNAGSLPFAATLAIGTDIVAADVVDLESLGGYLVRRIQIKAGMEPSFSSPGPGIQNSTQAGSGGSPSQFGGTTIYVPIGEGGIGVTWVQGQVCVQQMQVVGVVGAVVTQEVVSASCESGWDGACSPPDCEGTVGGIRETVDPGVLAGG